MINEFVRYYNIFQEQGLEDSLIETLHLFDLLSGGSLSKIDPSRLETSNIDLKRIAELRKQGVPMKYILGKTIFMGLTLHCTPDTLIPRKDTELLVESTLELIREKQTRLKSITIIDIGTGCGNIAVSIAMNMSNVEILASDISSEAVEIARKNVDRYCLSDRITLFCGDLFDPFTKADFGEKIDVIVSNPPYIPTNSLKKLGSDIIDHESIIALDAGPYGIDIFRRLIADSVPLLKRGGALIFEIGAGQENLVTRLLERNGNFEEIRHIDDGAEVRVVSAVKKSSN